MEFNQMPPVPNSYTQRSYTTDGKPVIATTYPPQQQTLGANFSGLIGNHVTVPVSGEIVPATKGKKKTTVNKNTKEIVVDMNSEESTEVAPVNSKEIVENTIYEDTYTVTNAMTYNVIGQTDALLNDCKQELDYIRSQRNMKGKYHYMNATIASMSSLLGTKLAAIKEINNTIKNANDAEYRRFKDMRAIDSTDDNKAIMDAYSAFISAPVGAPEYKQPGTMALTGGLNGVIRADYPPEVQKGMDIGMANYLSHLTPEENLMLLDGNENIEEVLVWDQATGNKEFKWMDTSTKQFVPNLPPSSNLVVEDYVIDPKTMIAKNTNLNSVKKVITVNQGAFDKF